MDDVTLGLARGLQMAGAFGVFGTILLTAALLPPSTAAGLPAALRRLVWLSLSLALLAGLAWFVLQSANMAGSTDFNELINAFPIVAETTRFAHLLALRLVLLVAAALCWQCGQGRLAVALSGLAVVAEAALDHGAAMGGGVGAILFISVGFHLLAAAAWLGSLPALLMAVQRLPLREAAGVLRRYSPFGVACVLTMLVTACVQSAFLIGAPAALVNSVYGRVAACKILALALLIALASLNRYRLGPALLKRGSDPGRGKILCSIALEIAVGLSAVLAAGLLLNLAPPTMAAMLGPQ